MAGLFGTFKTDSSLETDGVEVPFPGSANADGSVPTFIVARMSKSNKAYHNELERLFKPHQRQQQLGTLPLAKSEEIVTKAFIKGCIKGWRNVQTPDGVEIPYSPEKAADLFAQLPELLSDLQEHASTLANYKAEIREVVSGN